MIETDLKHMIKDVEALLKKDDRFKENGDNLYKKQMKKIYQESKYNKKPIDMTGLANLANLNDTVDIGDLAYIRYINKMLVSAKEKIDDLIHH